MKQKKKVPLFLEPLEDRWVPATVRYLGGTLIVSNPSVSAGTSSLKLQFDSTNHVAVTDFGNGNGSYTVGGEIIVLGGNAKATITVDLGGQTYTGDLLVTTGNGSDTLNIQSTGIGVGTIAGNVTVVAGNGTDSVNLNATGATSMTVGGNVNVTTTYGKETFTLGNPVTPTTVLGSLTLTNPSVVNIGEGQQDVIGGNLNISSTLVSTGVNTTLGSALSGIIVEGNFSMTGGSGNDSLTVRGASGSVNSQFLGSFNVNTSTAAGVGADSITFLSGPTLISGNLNVQTGAASTTFNTPAGLDLLAVQGNAYLNFGDNNNSFLPTGDIIVAGNLQITEGNGNDSVFLGGSDGGSRVGGNLIINLGNGNDSTTVINGVVGGLVEYRSGNGMDNLQLGNGASSTNYNGFAVFGNGADTLTLATGGLVSGTYIGGTNLANVFQQSFGSVTATLSPYFSLVNFP